MSAIRNGLHKAFLFAVQMIFFVGNKAHALETYICYENPYRCVILTDSESVNLSDLDLEKLIGIEEHGDTSEDDL